MNAHRDSKRRPGFAAASVAICAALALSMCGPAVAAAAEAATSDSPADWAFVDIIAQYDQGATSFLIGGELATGTPLPSAVELAVPASSTPLWVGQIAQSTEAADEELPYKITKRGTMDIYSFTLTKSPLGQVEALVPGIITPTDSGYSVALKWVAPSAVPNVRAAVVMPPNAQVTKEVAGAKLASDPNGNKYYYVQRTNVKAGDTVALEFAYSTSTAIDTGLPGQGGAVRGSTLLYLIVGLALVAVVALAVVVLRQNAARRQVDDDTGDAESAMDTDDAEQAEAPEPFDAEDDARE